MKGNRKSKKVEEKEGKEYSKNRRGKMGEERVSQEIAGKKKPHGEEERNVAATTRASNQG